MMKKIILVLMLITISLTGTVFASDEKESNYLDQTSITCTNMNTREVISSISVESVDFTIANYAAKNSLRHDLGIENDENEKSARVIICCMANPPTRRVQIDYHVTSSTKCDLMRQYLTQCTNCGAILNEGAAFKVNTHTPGSSGCPN